MGIVDEMFAAYLHEKEGKHTHFMDEGFFVYKVLPQYNEFWVCFIYIKPEHRCGGAFRVMMDRIKLMGEAAGCKQIIADIDYRNNGAEETLQIFLKRGMKIGDIRDNRTIWLYYPLINNNSKQELNKEHVNG